MGKLIWNSTGLAEKLGDNVSFITGMNIRKQPTWDERYAKASAARQLLMDSFPEMTEAQLDRMELST